MVLSGSLRPPSTRQYIRNALTELGATVSSGGPPRLAIPINDLPDPAAQRNAVSSGGNTVGIIEQADAGKKVKASAKTKIKASRIEIPSVQEVAARPSPSKGSFAYPIVSVIEDEEDPHLWRTPQEEADYRLALLLSRPVGDRTVTNRYQPEPTGKEDAA